MSSNLVCRWSSFLPLGLTYEIREDLANKMENFCWSLLNDLDDSEEALEVLKKRWDKFLFDILRRYKDR